MNTKKAVYILLENSGSNKFYVGSSMDLDTRFKSYNRKQNGKRIIDNTINKYGFANFNKVVIPFNDDISEYDLRLWEGFYIRLFGSYHKENEDGMNLVINPNLSPSKDINVRKKISEATRGIKKEWLSERNKNNKYCLGRTGELHPFSKKVINLQDGKKFESIKDAADFYNISRPAMRYRINNNPNIYKFL